MAFRHLLAPAILVMAILGCSRAEAAAPQTLQTNLPVDSPANANAGDDAHVSLPLMLQSGLAYEFGNYKDLVTPAELMNALQSADVVCLGEAHYDPRDMETAFEITRALAQHRHIALAVERFSYDLQPDLDRLNGMENGEDRLAEIDAIIQNKEYQTVWGTKSWDQSGYPVNTPSQASFEAMVRWAASARVPIIGMDLTLAERSKGPGDNVPYRNQLWKIKLDNFKQNHREDYLIVVIGGIDHINNSRDSLPSLLKRAAFGHVISVGQRDAMYHYPSSTIVADLAKDDNLSDLIVQQPEYALVNGNGVATFPAPPDYWIVAHTPDTWH